MSKQFYDNTTLLSKLDIDGRKPEIYITSGARTGGKSFCWKKYLLDLWLEDRTKKPILLFRKADELTDCLEAFLKDLKETFPEKYGTLEASEQSMARGVFYNLFINEEHFGYAMSLTSSDKIRKKSAMFVDAWCLFFDEFQSETEDYLSDEITRFQSIHMSVARGSGKHVRYLPVFMVSNNISLLNPYYISMGIYSRLNSAVHFLRGRGYVLECTHSKEAAEEMDESGFNRAFGESDYLKMARDNTYLLDSDTFIERKNVELCSYQCTILYDNRHYGVWLDYNDGTLYCSRKFKPDYPFKVATSAKDHNTTTMMVAAGDPVMKTWRVGFNRGVWRFETLMCKKVIIDTLGRMW